MESNFTLGQIKNHWKLELELELGNFVPQNVEAPASIELWVLRMQEFYYTIEYKPDCENIVDALSRLGCCSNQQVGRIRNVAEGCVRLVAADSYHKSHDNKRGRKDHSHPDTELSDVSRCIREDHWNNKENVMREDEMNM